MKYLDKKQPNLDPNWFKMSKIPDLAWQLRRLVVDHRFIQAMKKRARFVSQKFGNRHFVQIIGLEEWMGLEPGEIHRRYRPELEGVR